MLSDISQHREQAIFQGPDPALGRRRGNHGSDQLVLPANIILHPLPPYSPELNPQENIWGEIREKIFKNYALKSMEEVYGKLEEAALYIQRNPKIVKSITSFPYIAKSL
jgi:transposase